MHPIVLVAFATKNGSTEEVAAEIASGLTAHGVTTDLRAARDVATLEGYDGVVLGSALYFGRLHTDARAFLRRHGSALAGLPVAVFAMGPRTLGADEVAESRRQLERGLAAAPAGQPFATAIFGGAFDPARQRFPFNRMPAADARDWNAIRAWATALAARFTPVDAAA